MRFLTAKTQQCGVTNLYSDPAQLGIDRWAALVAARALAIDTLLEFTAVGAVWALVYGAVFWRWGLDERERATLLRALAGGRPTQPALGDDV